jgi:Na+/H+ antiporter
MFLFEAILFMLATAVFLLAVANKTRIPYPVLLAVAGGVIALAPFNTAIHLDPDLILALFVGPVLLDAAFDTSIRDLKKNWLAIASLVLVAVGLTTAAVAWVVHMLTPSLPWAAAVAIGAIVAPPDAASAMAVLRDLKLPHRIKVILGGEALLNDASTLLIYRLALTAVASSGGIGAEVIAPAFLLSIVGSVAAGLALAWAVARMIARIKDAPSSIILQFVSTFGVWVLAEQLQLSPILTMVMYAMTLARSRAAYQPAELRVPSFAVWETVVLVLNILAFLLIGLELGQVLAAAPAGALGRWSLVGAAVLATVIVVRMMWTITAALVHRWHVSRLSDGAVPDGSLPDWQSGLVVGWAGTRGIVTVATALALPPSFPERGMFLFLALIVTLGTLLIQGLTLRMLVNAMKLSADDLVDSEIRHARAEAATAALVAIGDDQQTGAEALRDELRQERDQASTAESGDGRANFPIQTLRAHALRAQRERLLELRNGGRIGDDAFHRLEEELDLAELATATRI